MLLDLDAFLFRQYCFFLFNASGEQEHIGLFVR